MSCTTSDINSQSSSDAICQYALTACAEKWDLLNFFQFYFCGINENIPVIVILSIIIIAFTLNILSSTADKYLAPSLEFLSKRLKLSEAVAGVTFLAFANGAADVISGVVAGGKAADGIDIAVGGLFGACLFTITVVFARCIQGGGEIKVDRDSFFRDCTFLLLATIYFIVISLTGYLSLPTAIGFLIIYGFYIGVVVVQEKRKRAIQALTDPAFITELAKMSRNGSLESIEKHIPNPSVVIPDTHSEDTNGSVDIQTNDPSSQSQAKAESKEEEDPDNPTTFSGKALKYYNMPLLFIRNLTIFPFEQWDKWRVIAPPFLGTLFILWNFNLMPFLITNWYLLTGLGVLAAAVAAGLFFAGSESTLERFGTFFGIWAFVQSCFWILLIVTCFLDFLALIEIISGLPISFLSLTLIAWGTSMDDFFVDYIIAKNGKGTMAVIGVFGGQLFNMLVGFGLSLIRQTANRGTIEIDLYQASRNDVLVMILMGAQLVVLVLMLVFVHSGKYVVGKKMNIFLMSYYGLFLFSVTMVSFFMKN